MPFTPQFEHLERSISAVLELVLWCGAAALVTFGSGAVVASATRRHRSVVSSSRIARAVGGFVAALASGDFERADVEAGRVLCVNDHEGRIDQALRHLRERVRRCGRVAAGEHPPLEFFDAHTVLGCGMAEFTRVVDSPASFAEWFGVVRQPKEASAVIHTGVRVLRLHGVVEQWQPEVGTLVTEARTTGGSPVRSHVTIREAMVPAVRPTRQGVQVWVHVELPADRHGRRALTCLRPAIEQGLRRLEAEFDTR